MRNQQLIEAHYHQINEEERLLSQYGYIEYMTTMKYIHDYLKKGMRILEVGAGTGRYSVALAREGYEVDAIELTWHNLEQLKQKIRKEDRLKAQQGDALDLSRYQDETFDMTLVLGPMYHLYCEEDKLKALKEAIRVTKKEGLIYVAYCMNEAVVLTYCFMTHHLQECLAKKMLTEDYKCVSKPEDIFEMVRVEDIEHLTGQLDVERLQLIATDGATNYMKETVDAMDDETFKHYCHYHLSICERQDLIGASEHTLDILKRMK